ncbi:hypothetical protein AB4Z21_18525 [Paenibacillus sp. MCAF20]
MKTVTMSMEEYKALEILKEGRSQSEIALSEFQLATELLMEFVKLNGNLEQLRDWAAAKLETSLIDADTSRGIVEYIESYDE